MAGQNSVVWACWGPIFFGYFLTCPLRAIKILTWKLCYN